ncbi:MAG: metal-sensing transcriptional repressor [Lachnospiraceae bacterium]|jgi:DNA-binding FrmR family transcriptional regulator|nr:metal-sensing transcriptional repressor [Lachnospiraceae bacterium]
MGEQHSHAGLHPHTHTDADGHTYTHTHAPAEGAGHTHAHTHSHTHDPEEIRSVVNRLSRCIGHLEKVRQMVESGEDCSDVLIQLAAVRSALNNAGKLLLKGHLEHCIQEAVLEEDDVAIEKMKAAIDRFIS